MSVLPVCNWQGRLPSAASAVFQVSRPRGPTCRLQTGSTLLDIPRRPRYSPRMATLVAPSKPARREIPPRRIPPLENGAHLTAAEFLRRFQAMPEVKKAELINGVVIMASPVRLDQHGEPDGLIQGWLCNYCIATPGVKHAINSTIRLNPDDVPQPDGLLRLLPECGGQSRLDEKGYLPGPPEIGRASCRERV